MAPNEHRVDRRCDDLALLREGERLPSVSDPRGVDASRDAGRP